MEKALAEKTGGYLIGDVAQMVGLSRDALRFYEQKGIIRADKKSYERTELHIRYETACQAAHGRGGGSPQAAQPGNHEA